MLKRTPPTKIGDIFEIKTSRNTKRYFQFVATDTLQLYSSVIRVFKKEYPIDYIPNPDEIIDDEMDFYTHVFHKIGLKLEFWTKVGKHINIGIPEEFLFKDTNDYGFNKKPFSDKWYIWYIGDKTTTRIGFMNDKYRHAEIGIVFTPKDIHERINNGKYKIQYPE